eukprot:1160595-Pelagomonas_calceolata.AAC.3
MSWHLLLCSARGHGCCDEGGGSGLWLWQAILQDHHRGLWRAVIVITSTASLQGSTSKRCGCLFFILSFNWNFLAVLAIGIMFEMDGLCYDAFL